MTNPPERIVWFYGRHQPDLFCCLAQEIPSIEFYEGLPTDIELMFDRSETFVSSMISCRVRVGISWSKTSLHLNLSVVLVSQNLFYFILFLFFIWERNAEPSL